MYLKIYLKNLFIVFFISLMLFSCEKSQKGNWTAKDKTTQITNCNAQLNTQLAGLPDLTKLGNITSQEKKEICECFISKVEANYTPEALINDTNANKAIKNACLFEVIMGRKGAWKAKFKIFFRDSFDKRIEFSASPETEQKIIDCLVMKLEQQVAPQDLPASNALITQLDKVCMTDVENRKGKKPKK